MKRWTEQEYHDLFMQKVNDLESKRMNTFEKEAYKKRTVFISGKVSGLPRWWVVIKFLFWDLFYTGMGYQVMNPAKHIPENWTDEHDRELIISRCMAVIRDHCDFIFMIPGWRKSDGAKIEFKKAAELDLTCLNSGRTKREFDQRAMMYKADREIEGARQMIKGMYKGEAKC